MSNTTAMQVDVAISVPERSFQIDGRVVEVLPGSGSATLLANSGHDLSLSRGTTGLHFEELSVGDRVNCQVAFDGRRVLYAHQQTQPVQLPKEAQSQKVLDAHFQVRPLSARSGVLGSKRRSMTKEEFIADYCRRWGVAWADVSKYRVALPFNNTMGWTMVSTGGQEDEQTVHSPLEPLPE